MTTPANAPADAPRYYQKATANTRRLLDTITADQWQVPTPCSEWNVKQLLNHMVSSLRNVVSIMSDRGPQNFGDVLGNDPIAAFDDACTAANAAFGKPGAMEEVKQTRRGSQLAGQYALGQVQEMLVHGWDLAVALGKDTAMDPELLEISYARALSNREQLRAGGSAAWGESEAEASDDADTQTKYLAILGRTA